MKPRINRIQMENKLESNFDNNGSANTAQHPWPKPRRMPLFEVSEDIVISGIAGRFPDSDNIDELAENLFKNIDLVTSDDRRWPKDLNNGLVSRGGKIKELDKFDSSFFSILTLLADVIDPQSRIMLETTYEAICDAGVNPQAIRGSTTGVYIGLNTVACTDGIPQDDFQDCRQNDALQHIYGSAKPLYANRISFLMDFHGPSIVMDTACSSSLVALVYALNDMRLGICDNAIVATANLAQAPFTSYVFEAGNILSLDGKCKVWDKKANGYVRSETIGALFLQRKSEAKRNYATVLHAKTNIDGFKPTGNFAPFWLTQRNLLIETFQEAGVHPSDVKYFESHGTGTPVGDPPETRAIAEAYCTQQREEPLLIGAVKSNMGHAEGASGLCSLAKCLITFENQCIPANLHLEEVNPDLKAIIDGTVVPVVKNTPFSHNIIGVNSFGIGGVNANALLKANNKLLTDEMSKIADIIPRLVNVCGRTEEAVKYIFDFIENNPNKANREFLALLTDVMKSITIKGSSNFPYRGYMIIKEKINEQNAVQYEYSRTTTTANDKQSVWLVFTGMGSQWTAMAKSLMPIKPFADSIKRSATVLKPYNTDLMHILLSDDQNALKMKITNPFVALTSMQIALYDVIRLLNLKIDGIIGHSFGEIACAYVDGCLTQEQAVLTAYWRGKVVENANQNKLLPRGMLAAVGLSWEEIKKRCPEGIVPACHNGSDSVTISGTYDIMVKFLDELNAENIFAKPVTGGGFPYHSKIMNIVAPQLLDALNCIIRKPKQRSNKWISTSFPPEEWHQEMAKTASGDYFTNNLVSPVYFSEALDKIEKDSLVIEVAPHSYFESIFKSCHSSIKYTCLMKKTESDNLNHILSSIGTLYTYGLNPDIENLYPRIEWPVSRGTQSISSLFKWDHERSNAVKTYPEYHNFNTSGDYRMKISVLDPYWRFLKDHAVDGKVLFPATGYLWLVWRRMAVLKGQPWMKTEVAFENIRFFRSTLLTDKNTVEFTVRILEATGEFTVTESSTLVCTGKVYLPDETTGDNWQTETISDDNQYSQETLTTKEIYKEFRIRGYDYGPNFQGLIEASPDGKRGKAKWNGHVISFMDSVLQLTLVSFMSRSLIVPTGFQSMRIDPNILFKALDAANTTTPEEESGAEQSDTKSHVFNETAIGSKAFEELATEIKPDLKSEADILTGLKLEANVLGLEDQLFNTGSEAKIMNKMLTVCYDTNIGSIKTNGIEFSGFSSTSIPRKAAHQGLLLEKYGFIANNEQLAIDVAVKQQIIEYIEVCCSLIERLTKITGKINKPILNGYKYADEETVNKYLNSPKPNHKILNVFKNLINSDENRNVINESRHQNDVDILIKDSVLSENNIDIDVLKTVFTSERLIRPLLDIIAENSCDRKSFKVLELNPTNTILVPTIMSAFRKSCVGFMNVDYCLATPSPSAVTDDIKPFGSKVIEWNTSDLSILKDVSSLDLLIYRPNIEICNDFSIDEQIKALNDSVKDNGFILLITRNALTPPEVAINELSNKNTANKEIFFKKELDNFVETAAKANLKVVAKKCDSLTSTLVLLRKVKTDTTTQTELINITNGKYEQWVNVLKGKIAENKDSNTNLWLVANDTPINGIIGLVNCLRLEPGGDSIRCIFDYDNKLPLPVDFTKSPYNEVIEMDLATNIYKDGEWGTLRHTTLPEERETVMIEHAYLNIVSPGDLSSLKWFAAPHTYYTSKTISDQKQLYYNVYYSALNFKDVVIVTGKMQAPPQWSSYDCVIGVEFAGRRSDTGRRVMGVVPFQGFATAVRSYKEIVWHIPDQWTLEDAATVPIVYMTAYYALIMRGNLLEGESVLIHSGAGGVGQAAIHICQSLNCEIFVTVGNNEKREFIKNTFNIDDSHIGNSRDTSFEKQVMTVTKGKGVNAVLNSLTEDMLQASVRCLAKHGRFLEIGKYDMEMNNSLGLNAFLKNIDFQAISLDTIFFEPESERAYNYFINHVRELVSEGIANNVVKPIVRTVYDMNECEQAFRYMTTGKHIGKVLIKIRNEETEKCVVNPKLTLFKANTKTWFHPSKVYIIIGGLGGFGLELVNWMAMRGARKLLLTSRTGIKNNYQKWILKRISEMEKLDYYNIEIKVSSNNAITFEDANSIIDEANRMGSVGGIFNLALVLNDGFIENQTAETFKKVCEPKLDLLSNLDVITQQKCPQLDYFVCFSSQTSGRGNAGQTNYGYANSAMERICEVRRNKGLHGLAVQYGAIGDVGIVAEQLIDTVFKGDVSKLFSGILLQRISSCLDVLDRYLQTTFPVMSSFEKDFVRKSDTKAEDEVWHQLCVQLNIDNRPDSETLGDIGLESMMAVQIQQTLEREFKISLTIVQIRKLSVADIKEFRDSDSNKLKQYSDDIKTMKANLSKIRLDITNNHAITALNNVKTGKPIFILPPIEGIFDNFNELAAKINRPVIGINWTKQLNDLKDFKKVYKYYRDIIANQSKESSYDLIVHSFGALIGFNLLRKHMPIKSLIFLDTIEMKSFMDNNSKPDDNAMVSMFLDYLSAYIPDRIGAKIRKELMNTKGGEEKKVNRIIELVKEYALTGKDIEEFIRTSFDRADMMVRYAKKKMDKLKKYEYLNEHIVTKTMKKFKTDLTVIKLLKTNEDLDKIEETVLKNYGFNKKQFDGKFTVHPIIGTEAEFLTTNVQKVSDIINNQLV